MPYFSVYIMYNSVSYIPEPYFTFMKNGVKTKEAKFKTDLWNDTIVGSTITFSNGNDKFDAMVTQVIWYDDTSTVDAIRKMLLAEEIKTMLPDLQSDDINTAISVHLKMN